MSRKVKPCPFCGGTKIYTFENRDRGFFALRCADCEASSSRHKTECQACRAWNKRPGEKLLREEIAERDADLEFADVVALYGRASVLDLTAKNERLQNRIEALEWLLEVQEYNPTGASRHWFEIYDTVSEQLGGSVALRCDDERHLEYERTLKAAREAVES